jgi:hypothetical protein
MVSSGWILRILATLVSDVQHGITHPNDLSWGATSTFWIQDDPAGMTILLDSRKGVPAISIKRLESGIRLTQSVKHHLSNPSK